MLWVKSTPKDYIRAENKLQSISQSFIHAKSQKTFHIKFTTLFQNTLHKHYSHHTSHFTAHTKRCIRHDQTHRNTSSMSCVLDHVHDQLHHNRSMHDHIQYNTSSDASAVDQTHHKTPVQIARIVRHAWKQRSRRKHTISCICFRTPGEMPVSSKHHFRCMHASKYKFIQFSQKQISATRRFVRSVRLLAWACTAYGQDGVFLLP